MSSRFFPLIVRDSSVLPVDCVLRKLWAPRDPNRIEGLSGEPLRVIFVFVDVDCTKFECFLVQLLFHEYNFTGHSVNA